MRNVAYLSPWAISTTQYEDQRLVLNWPACPQDRPVDPDQQDRADESGNQVAEPSPKVDPKDAQNEAGNRRPDLPSTIFISSPISLFMNCSASQPATPPMMMAAIQPACASSMARLLKRRALAPDFDCLMRFRCTAAALTIYPLAQLDRSPLARVDLADLALMTSRTKIRLCPLLSESKRHHARHPRYVAGRPLLSHAGI
jgi:hypothetical protein